MSKYEQERVKAKRRVAGQLEDLQRQVSELKEREKQHLEDLRVLRMQNEVLQREKENMQEALAANLSAETLEAIVHMASVRDAIRSFRR